MYSTTINQLFNGCL